MTEDQTTSVRRRPEDPLSGAGNSVTGGTALCMKTTRAKKRNTDDPNNQPPRAVTDENVAVRQVPLPISPVHRKQRTTWTTDMNKYVVQCYYRLTKVETSTEPYGAELHRLVIEKFPQLNHKTVQNILDQRRSIFINSRLPSQVINQIKDEIAVELGMKDPEQQIAQQQQHPETMMTEPQLPLSTTEESFRISLMKYDGIEPTHKPRLPKLRENKTTKAYTREIDNLIKTEIRYDTTIEELHGLIYAGAFTVLKLNDQNPEKEKKIPKKNKQPAWEMRINKNIRNLRKSIGILTERQKAGASSKVQRAAEIIIQKFQSKENPTIIEILDHLKQKLAATAKKLKRYKKSNLRREHNNLFEKNQSKFYQTLESKEVDKQEGENSQIPSEEDIREYWGNMWGSPVNHKASTWLYSEKASLSKLKTMQDWKVTEEDVKRTLKKLLNWRAPGPDKIQNYWLKAFPATHEHLAKCLTTIIEEPQTMPIFMTTGITYLIHKTQAPTPNASNYRPITCLPTIYKLLTSIIAEKIYKHLETNNLLSEEQKGCRKKSKGCKEQLIIDSIVTEDAKRKKGSLYFAYIDYKKAFDSVPHTWLIEVLQLYKIDNHIKEFLTHAMAKWNTQLLLNTPKKQIDAGGIEIKRGIFQGDSLSPIWFCLALQPLTTILNNQKKGYELKSNGTQLSHLWYMDDLKLFAKKKEDLHRLLDCVSKFSADIQMAFGLEKCKMAGMVKGKWKEDEGYEINSGLETIMGLAEKERYKYLGYLQSQGIDHRQEKKKATDNYMKRLRNILKTELSARNTARAVNTYATAALMYTFGILNWTDTELKAIDIATRKAFTRFRAHHPHSSIERFHLPRKEGGRGIPSIPIRHYQQIDNLRNYFLEKAKVSPIHAAIATADNSTPLKLSDKNYDPKTKLKTTNEIKNQWKGKALHGRYITKIEEDIIDTQASQAWLRYGNLFLETEGFIVAIQDQVLSTKSYRRRILNQQLENVKCRMCGLKEESLDHLLSGCTVLAPKQHLERHNDVGKILYQAIIRQYMEETEMEPYYNFNPPPIKENEKYRIYWDRKIVTDRPVANNVPDIVFTQKEENITYIIDMAVPLAANIQKTQAEKISKYLLLADEIKAMWRMDRVIILPIVIGATGEIPKKTLESIHTLGLNTGIYMKFQKAVLLASCRLIRRVLNDEHHQPMVR